jgi:DnaJ family protein C protein 7
VSSEDANDLTKRVHQQFRDEEDEDAVFVEHHDDVLDEVIDKLSPPDEPTPLQYHTERAAELSRQGDYEAAYLAYKDALNLNAPALEASKLLEGKSQASLLTGRLDEAQADAQRALQLDPGSLRARIRLLRALLRRGDFVKAVEVGTELLAKDPTNQTARTDLASAQLNLRRLEAANAALASGKFQETNALAGMMLNESPGSMDALMLKAQALEQIGQVDEALSLTNRLMRDGGASNNAVLNLRARIFFDQERFDQAQKHLNEVLRVDPDDSKAGKLLKKVRKVVRLKSEGDEGFKQAQYEQAAERYAQCLLEVGGNGLALFRAKVMVNRAMCFANLGKHEDAVECCDRAVELQPEYVKAYARRASSLRALGGKERLERALMDFEKIETLQGEPTQESRENIRRAKQELKQAKRKDYYALLDITSAREAHTQEDIKKAYRRAALKWHPDRHTNSSPEEKVRAEATFKDVQEAFEVLSDPEKRRMYDRGMDLEEIQHGGASPFHQHHSHGYPDTDPDDLFRAYFAGGRGGGGFNF